MKAAGMVPLTLNAADMKALVTYVTSLGGRAVASAAALPASARVFNCTAEAEPAAAAEQSKNASATTRTPSGTSAPAPAKRSPQRQPKQRKRQLVVPQVIQPQPRGRPFTIRKAAPDATERVGPAARAGIDSYFQSVSAGSIDSNSESAQRRDESCRHGPADFECCRYGSTGYVRDQPRGNIALGSYTPGLWSILACASQSRTTHDNGSVDSVNWKS